MLRFEELAYESTPMGELTLRRRHIAAAGTDVFDDMAQQHIDAVPCETAVFPVVVDREIQIVPTLAEIHIAVAVEPQDGFRAFNQHLTHG